MQKFAQILLIISILLLPAAAIAQDNIEVTGEPEVTTNQALNEDLNNPFTIELEVGTQSPWDKDVPVKVIFTPNLHSERTEIAWDTPLGVTVQKKYDDFFTATEGQQYTVEATIKPEQPGSYNVVVNITNWGYGSNVTSSQRITLTFDDGLIVTPRTPGYAMANGIRLIIVFGVSIAIIAGVTIALFRGSKKLQKWLKPPQ